MADTASAKEHEEEVNMILENENIDMGEVEGELTSLEEEIFTELELEEKTVGRDRRPDDLPEIPKGLPVAGEGAQASGAGQAEEPMVAS